MKGIGHLGVRLRRLGGGDRLDELTRRRDLSMDIVAKARWKVTIRAGDVLLARVLPALDVLVHQVTGATEGRRGTEAEEEPQIEKKSADDGKQHQIAKALRERQPLAKMPAIANSDDGQRPLKDTHVFPIGFLFPGQNGPTFPIFLYPDEQAVLDEKRSALSQRLPCVLY